MPEPKKNSFLKNLNHNITTPQELAELGIISEEEATELEPIVEQFPMSITPYYLSLIEKFDESDPIYKMSIATAHELEDGGREDTSGEADNTIIEGLQHKYPNTVLLLSTNVCAMYCRHCFRKRMVGLTEEETLSFSEEAIAYVKENKEADNVLITGGDSFLNSNRVIENYLKGLTQIEHLKFIRFGTRTPVVMPHRINNDLCDILKKYSKKKTLYVVTQFNHPREFTKESIGAIKKLRNSGVEVLNQTVLLSGVNDDPKTLSTLFNLLVENYITPYYLFQCRPVKGVKGFFAVPIEEGIGIVDQTKALLSGVAKRFKYCLSHVNGKIEILGKTKNKQLLLKQHQAKEKHLINKIFSVPLYEGQTWLKDDVEYNFI